MRARQAHHPVVGYPTKNSYEVWYNEYQLKLEFSPGYARCDCGA